MALNGSNIGVTISRAVNTAARPVRAFRAGYNNWNNYNTGRVTTKFYSAGQITRTLVQRISSFYTNSIIPQAKRIGNGIYRLWNTVWRAIRVNVSRSQVFKKAKEGIQLAYHWVKQKVAEARIAGGIVAAGIKKKSAAAGQSIKRGASKLYNNAKSGVQRATNYIDSVYGSAESRVSANRAAHRAQREAESKLTYTDARGTVRNSYSNRPIRNKDASYEDIRSANYANLTPRQKIIKYSANRYEKNHPRPTTNLRGKKYNTTQQARADARYANRVRRHAYNVAQAAQVGTIGLASYGVYTGAKKLFGADQEE